RELGGDAAELLAAGVRFRFDQGKLTEHVVVGRVGRHRAGGYPAGRWGHRYTRATMTERPHIARWRDRSGLLIAAVVLTVLCWIMGNPRSSGPDEPSHMRAAASPV